MKILYDHQVFTWQKFGGISRYFYELMKHSKGLFEYDVSGIYSENEYVKGLGLYKEFPVKFNFKGKGRITALLNRSYSVRKIKEKKYDIIHPTYYDPYLLKNIKNISLFKKAEEDLSDEIYEEENIVYQGQVSSAHKSKYISEKQNYILFTGQRGGYKNFDRFIEAVAPLLVRYDLHLICTGQVFKENEVTLLSKHKIKDRTICKFVSDSELQDMYAKALLFVFPSLYEGFGIPILEAFSSGCPVILSNASCFPEIAEDAAIYFDPYFVDDMRQNIEKVLLDSSLQALLIEKGFERVKCFSWEKTVKQTYQLYYKILSLSSSDRLRLVITVYDMIHEFFPEYFPNEDKTAFNKYMMIKNADKIIAISHNTKTDILKLYPETDEKKIEVIHLGTSFM